MPIESHFVLYVSCGPGIFAFSYNWFVQCKILYVCGTCEFVNPTFHVFMYNTVCFWFCKFVYGVGILEGYSHFFA
jgi:hypothetical protein